MIRPNFTANVTPQFRVLSDDQIEEIHLATLEVLRRTGVVVNEPEGVGLLKKAGCWVDGERVFIPPHLVERALQASPPRVVLCDRNGDAAILLERNKVYYGTGSDTPNVVDPYTGERRLSTLEDVANIARVVDYLPNVSFLMCMGIASDVNEAISDVYHFDAMVNNTTKPIVYTAWNLDSLKDIVAMAEAVAGGAEALQRSPFLALYTEPISPLQHGIEAAQKLMWMAQKGLPVVYTPAVMTGASGPVTSAGGLVQANAELLSGLVMAQFSGEGMPFIYGGCVATMDMGHMTMPYASPEFMLNTAALTDMGRYYKLPVFSFAGCSDSKVFDQQASLEGAIWMLMAALSGGNLVHDVGYIDNGLTASFEMLVCMDEVAGLVSRILAGIEVTEDTMAVGTIDQVGPAGHYLGTDHTYRHFKKNWYPQLIDRTNYEKWKERGSLTLGDRALSKVMDILEGHDPPRLPEAVRAALAGVVRRAEERTRTE